MLTEKELRIIELFSKDIFVSYTIREIMKKIKTKSYNWTYLAVSKIIDLGILTKERKGNSSICKINLKSENSIIYLSFAEEIKAKKEKKLHWKNIGKLINKINVNIFSMLITGSYANGTATKKSDLDMVIICGNRENTKKILTPLKNEGELMIPEVHPYVFTETQFYEMLINKDSNYGKEIFRNNKIITGGEAYFRIVAKAVENGFNN